MTTLPALEAALDEAALRHYGKRRHQRRRFVLVPVAVAGCAAGVLLALPGPAERRAPPQQQPSAPVPAATLALSNALVRAPDVADFRVEAPVIPHAALPALADGYENETPYPPEQRDTFDWASTAVGPYDMSSINYERDVRALVQWRSACIWLHFWLRSDGEPRLAAAVVLADVPSWPALRDHPGNWADVPAQVRLADVDALELQYVHDCTPWRNSRQR